MHTDKEYSQRLDDYQELDMTVCIAALCENGQTAILAADRAVGRGPFVAEGPDCKITQVSSHVAVAVAGTPLDSAFFSQFDSNDLSNPASVAVKITNCLFKLKLELIFSAHIQRFGYPSYDSFIEKHRSSPDPTTEHIYGEVCNYELKTTVIVAGYNRSQDGNLSPGYIGQSDSQGRIASNEMPGYTTSGTGGFLAIGNLFSRSPMIKTMKVEEALYWVYEAKKMGERDKAVGKATDMAIITKDGYSKVSANVMDRLEEVYKALAPRSLDERAIESIRSAMKS